MMRTLKGSRCVWFAGISVFALLKVMQPSWMELIPGFDRVVEAFVSGGWSVVLVLIIGSGMAQEIRSDDLERRGDAMSRSMLIAVIYVAAIVYFLGFGIFRPLGDLFGIA